MQELIEQRQLECGNQDVIVRYVRDENHLFPSYLKTVPSWILLLVVLFSSAHLICAQGMRMAVICKGYFSSLKTVKCRFLFSPR